MDEALQNDCAGYPRCTINQKEAKQLVVGQLRWLLPCSDGWLSNHYQVALLGGLLVPRVLPWSLMKFVCVFVCFPVTALVGSTNIQAKEDNPPFDLFVRKSRDAESVSI